MPCKTFVHCYHHQSAALAACLVLLVGFLCLLSILGRLSRKVNSCCFYQVCCLPTCPSLSAGHVLVTTVFIFRAFPPAEDTITNLPGLTWAPCDTWGVTHALPELWARTRPLWTKNTCLFQPKYAWKLVYQKRPRHLKPEIPITRQNTASWTKCLTCISADYRYEGVHIKNFGGGTDCPYLGVVNDRGRVRGFLFFEVLVAKPLSGRYKRTKYTQQ